MKSVLTTLLFLIAGTAFAQPYPSKPIRSSFRSRLADRWMW